MRDTSDARFVNDYPPNEDACVELKNGRIVDVIKADDPFHNSLLILSLNLPEHLLMV